MHNDFAKALSNSQIAMPIVSEGALQQMAALTEDSPVHGMLMEWIMIRELAEAGRLTVLPLLLGPRGTHDSDAFETLPTQEWHQKLPAIVPTKTVQKASELLRSFSSTMSETLSSGGRITVQAVVMDIMCHTEALCSWECGTLPAVLDHATRRILKLLGQKGFTKVTPAVTPAPTSKLSPVLSAAMSAPTIGTALKVLGGSRESSASATGVADFNKQTQPGAVMHPVNHSNLMRYPAPYQAALASVSDSQTSGAASAAAQRTAAPRVAAPESTDQAAFSAAAWSVRPKTAAAPAPPAGRGKATAKDKTAAAAAAAAAGAVAAAGPNTNKFGATSTGSGGSSGSASGSVPAPMVVRKSVEELSVADVHNVILSRGNSHLAAMLMDREIDGTLLHSIDSVEELQSEVPGLTVARAKSVVVMVQRWKREGVDVPVYI